MIHTAFIVSKFFIVFREAFSQKGNHVSYACFICALCFKASTKAIASLPQIAEANFYDIIGLC